nr:site-specific integrase [Thiocystis violacea]
MEREGRAPDTPERSNRSSKKGYNVDLVDRAGRRLSLTREERLAFLAALDKQPGSVRTFGLVLAYTGCRLSEALSLTGTHVDFEARCLIFETLKKRQRGVFRQVPLPDTLIEAIDRVHGIRDNTRQGKALEDRLWPWSRTTGFRRVKEVLEAAGVSAGPHRSPKGLRHAYGVSAILAGVPLNLLAIWMGHASMHATALYTRSLGGEQQAIAERMWSTYEEPSAQATHDPFAMDKPVSGATSRLY